MQDLSKERISSASSSSSPEPYLRMGSNTDDPRRRARTKRQGEESHNNTAPRTTTTRQQQQSGAFRNRLRLKSSKKDLKGSCTKRLPPSGAKSLDYPDPPRVNTNGFSHLEWSASVPYNLAEEPDEVRGMKHSHSCQSMPSVSLEQLSIKQQKSRTEEDEGAMPQEKALESIKEARSKEVLNQEEASDSSQKDEIKVASTKKSDTPPPLLESSALVRSVMAKAESQDHTSQSPAEEKASSQSRRDSSTSSPSESQAPKPDKTEVVSPLSAPEAVSKVLATTSAQPPMSLERQHSQAELSRKLEEVRQKSRSTTREGIMLSQRPRARSEEAAKFPLERRPRVRLRSEGRVLDDDGEDDVRDASKQGAASSSLNAPQLIQTAMAVENKEWKRPIAPSLPPPPMQFRDPPRSEKKGDTSNRDRVGQIQKDLEERIRRRRSQYDLLMAKRKEELFRKRSDGHLPAFRSLSTNGEEESEMAKRRGGGGTVPVTRRRMKDEEERNSCSSMSRIETKKPSHGDSSTKGQNGDNQLQPQHEDGGCFLVERTGDWMETKSLPMPKNRNKDRYLHVLITCDRGTINNRVHAIFK